MRDKKEGSPMIFGMPTLLETKTLEECAELCRNLGLDFVELNMNLPQYQAEKIAVTEFERIAKKNSVFFTIHLDENLNPCDFNDRIADAYKSTALQSIEIAKQLSVPVLNMHLPAGVYFTLPDKKVFLFDEHEDAFLEKLASFRDACEAAIGESSIKICVENSSGYGRAAFLQKGLKLLLESPVFGLTFDIGHNCGIGGGDEPIILANRERLSHMHIHDARGERDHLAIGEGALDISKYLAMAQELDCRCVLETKTASGLRQSIVWLKERGWKSKR
jgi:sugar phosphate isomerase/epimerase